MVEVKGDYLDGDDSKSKRKLGRTWAACAGNSYQVFYGVTNKKLNQEGSYTLDEFMGSMKAL